MNDEPGSATPDGDIPGNIPIRPLWTATEVAEYFSIPKERLYRWAHEGRGPKYIKIGHNLRYRFDDVLAFVECHVVNPRE